MQEFACGGCGGGGFVEQDWDETAENFGEDVTCPHCDGHGTEW